MATDPSSILGNGIYSGGLLSNALGAYDSAGDYIGTPGGSAITGVSPVTGIGSIGVPGLSSDGGSGFGLNLGTAGLGLSALGTIGQLISGFGALKLAKKQFNYQKTIGNANLTNQIDSYNNSLEDKIRSRMVAENQPSSSADSYLSSHKLTNPLGS